MIDITHKVRFIAVYNAEIDFFHLTVRFQREEPKCFTSGLLTDKQLTEYFQKLDIPRNQLRRALDIKNRAGIGPEMYALPEIELHPIAFDLLEGWQACSQ